MEPFAPFVESEYEDYSYPKVSVILPTYNCSERISLTLKSILEQRYPNFELIIVDGGSTDRTLEVVKRLMDERIKIISVADAQRYVMINRGLSHARGEYCNILFPGDYYIHPRTLLHMMSVALDHQKPDLVYCGTMIRDGRSDPKILQRPFEKSVLLKGQQPTSLQSCWFLTETVRELGKFKTSYSLRGGFDLMCRFAQEEKRRWVSTEHVLTDYDLHFVTRPMIITHFIETSRIILHYFGIRAVLRWLFIQKDCVRLFRHWARRLKRAFFQQQ